MDEVSDPIKALYPAVDETSTPLPRSWNLKDKSSNLTVGLDGRTVTYQISESKKAQREPAAVRASHPIPASCGIYYFEVKIISKGKEGYIGVGLSKFGVPVNRLPGWDKYSFGYHGDDGHSFDASHCGTEYGPTFTSDDVVGCCVNFISKEIFYTKNGVALGRASDNRVHTLYPTVGLKTAGESVRCNFGQEPFVFDFNSYVRHVTEESLAEVTQYNVPNQRGQFSVSLQKVVLSYLTHCGYCQTAETFADSSGMQLNESLDSMLNRQRLQRLVLSGHIQQAIDLTEELYPGLLDNSPDLLFMLKVRQFIEMVSGTEKLTVRSEKPERRMSRKSSLAGQEMNGVSNGVTNGHVANGSTAEAMEVDSGSSCSKEDRLQESGEMESSWSPSDSPPHKRQFCTLSDDHLQALIQFGRDLYRLSRDLRQEHGKNDTNKLMLQEAFSLLAYADPWTSPVSDQLQPKRREGVAAALNTAILQSLGQEKTPLLEMCVAHTQRNLSTIADRLNEGWVAYVSAADWVRQAERSLTSHS